jgi:hypothetical protein
MVRVSWAVMGRQARASHADPSSRALAVTPAHRLRILEGEIRLLKARLEEARERLLESHRQVVHPERHRLNRD